MATRSMRSSSNTTTITSNTIKSAIIDNVNSIDSLPINPSLNRPVILLLLLFTIIIRIQLFSWPYSGYSTPPLYGDYEAQRHWMEITVQLPANQWYINSTSNDLLYWGLDYPPLTAYISYGYGKLASMIQPELIELYTSRGLETPRTKLFMRLTVLFSDLLTYIPAIILFYYTIIQNQQQQQHQQQSNNKITIILNYLILFILLLFPALILIDHGHFQYNNICLGLVLYSIILLYHDYQLLSSIFYIAAINFKQMSLYYSTAYFTLLLALQIKYSYNNNNNNNSNKSINYTVLFMRLIRLGIIVIGTFILMFLPIIISELNNNNTNNNNITNIELIINTIKSVLIRIFPFNRGLYEDKVSNFWCSIGLFIKIKQYFTQTILIRISTILTLLALLPSCWKLFTNIINSNTTNNSNNRFNDMRSFLYCAIISSYSFYLFSFQVHEKTILIPLLPIILTIYNYHSSSIVLLINWNLLIAAFSMFPLLIRDGLTIPYIVLQLITIIITVIIIHTQYYTTNNTINSNNNNNNNNVSSCINFLTKQWIVLFILSLFGCIIIHFSIFIIPNRLIQQYPDLITYLFTLYSAAHFIGFMGIFYYLQFNDSNTDYNRDNKSKIQ